MLCIYKISLISIFEMISSGDKLILIAIFYDSREVNKTNNKMDLKSQHSFERFHKKELFTFKVF